MKNENDEKLSFLGKEEFIRVANNAARYNPTLKDSMSKYRDWTE